MADVLSVVCQRLGLNPSDPLAPELAATLNSAISAAQAAWPRVRLDPSAFAQVVMRALPQTGPASFVGDLGQLLVADLFLASGVLAGDAAALTFFGDELLPSVCRSLKRVSGFGALTDDAAQTLFERLLLPAESGPPQLAGYAGRGPLVHWLRTIAVRELLLLRRRAERRGQLENDAIADASAVDVELEMIRRLHGEDFRRAFAQSFAALTARQRCVLRMHVLDGLNIDQIAQFYATHRTTAFRWLEAARQALALGIRKTLSAELTLNHSELESFLGLVGSELTFSLNRLLRTSHSPSK